MALPAFETPSEQRTRNMRALRSSGNTSTEKRLCALLRTHRIRGWRSQPRDILGKPDFLIKEKRLVVFVDGCFFHGCPGCGHIARISRPLPRSNFASDKIKLLKRG